MKLLRDIWRDFWNGVDYTFTSSTVMDMMSAIVVLALARVWRVTARHGDVPNAYLKAEKEENLEIFLHVTRCMEFESDELSSLGTSHKSKMALTLRKILYRLKQARHLWAQLLHLRYSKIVFV